LHITRDSVKAAFALGIQARQILRFLEKHAHPKLRQPTGGSTLPDNVVDQIWLWDRETGRVKFTKVYQHECLMGAEEFKAVLHHARATGALSWHSDRRQQLLLDYRYVDQMQAYARQWRARAVS
jgi:transcription initiation factor TFIIH subunit 4